MAGDAGSCFRRAALVFDGLRSVLFSAGCAWSCLGLDFSGLCLCSTVVSLDRAAGKLSLRDLAPFSVTIFWRSVTLFWRGLMAVSLVWTVQGDECHCLRALLSGDGRWYGDRFGDLLCHGTCVYVYFYVYVNFQEFAYW